MSDVAIVKCTTAISDPQIRSSNLKEIFSGWLFVSNVFDGSDTVLVEFDICCGVWLMCN